MPLDKPGAAVKTGPRLSAEGPRVFVKNRVASCPLCDGRSVNPCFAHPAKWVCHRCSAILEGPPRPDAGRNG